MSRFFFVLAALCPSLRLAIAQAQMKWPPLPDLLLPLVTRIRRLATRHDAARISHAVG